MCTLYVRDDLICKKIKYKELLKFSENCVDYMYEMFGFAKKMKYQNCVTSTGNCVHYMYGMSGFGEK